VPRTPSRALVGLLSRRGTGLYFRRFLAWLREQGKIVSEGVSPRYRGVSLRPLAKTHGDRLVVVGDAAGQVKPTTGGGIYYGLLCADIAADYLARALRSDKLSARDMAGYEREWRRRLGRELRFGGYARRLYERLDDGQLDRLFDITEHSGLDKTLWNRPDLSFDWHGEMVWGLAKGLVSEAIGAVGLPFS